MITTRIEVGLFLVCPWLVGQDAVVAVGAVEVLDRFADDDDFAGGVGEDVVGGVAEVDGGGAAADEGGLFTAAVDGVGVGDAEHEEVDGAGDGEVDDGGAGAAGLEEDGFAGDAGLFGGGFGLGEAGFAVGGGLRLVGVDGEGAFDFDDVGGEDAGLAAVDAGKLEGKVEGAPGFRRAVEGDEDGDACHVRRVLAAAVGRGGLAVSRRIWVVRG